VSDAVVAQAIAVAEVSSRVVIVDVAADLTGRLELTTAPGLRDWLNDPSRPLEDVQVALSRNVALIPTGGDAPIEAITSAQVQRLSGLLIGSSLIVAGGSLDTAPAGIVPAGIADAVVVVAVRDRTHRAELRRMVETLGLVGATLAGSMLLVPGDRASRMRAAAVRTLEPVTATGAARSPVEPSGTVGSTQRPHHPG
jgi:hypothetical protein